MSKPGPILLVEDRRFAGMSLERLLTLYGFPVVVAGGVERALEMLAERGGDPAVLVVDMVDSRAACEELVQGARERGLGRAARIVGLAPLDLEDPQSFGGLGLTAVVDRNALPEELLFRLNDAHHAAAEGRRHIRVFTQIPVTCSSGASEFVGTVANLGQGGVFVQTAEVMQPDDECGVRFELPSGAVSAEGRVRFRVAREPIGGQVHLSGFGLDLTWTDEQMLQRVAHHVAELQSEWRALLGGS